MAYFEYRSISDLDRAIIRNLSIFPHDIDLVVGIPRSGMLPANLLALYLNKPYTDIDSFMEGKIYATGERGEFINSSEIKKILIIDDFVASGKAILKTKERTKNISHKYNILFAAVYANKESIGLVDFFCEMFDGFGMAVFQWNIFLYPKLLDKTCFDIDGVLCTDPPGDDDGAAYLDYIKNAIPLYLPAGGINTIVTCRLEKYRNVTEEWLKKWNIQYRKLIMLDLPNKREREKWGQYGIFKGNIYRNTECILFIESSLKEAADIKEISGKPVFCTETFSMINNNALYEKLITRMKKMIPGNVKKAVKEIMQNRRKQQDFFSQRMGSSGFSLK